MNIPEELKRLDQWVCIKSDSKLPMKSRCYEPASSVDPSTWSDYETAIQSVEYGYYDNIGFVFNDNGIVGIDIDKGFDEDGFISEIAADIVKRCKSYTEKSRSGRGFHVLLKGSLPFKGRNNLKGVEIYKSARYFIMTGNTLVYDKIIENQEAIDYIVETYFPEMKENEYLCKDRLKTYNPVWEDVKVGDRIKLRPIYPRIPNGSRNICLTSLAGLLHNQGYSKEQIFNEISYANIVACDPPLDERELKTITKSVTRYKR